MTRTHPNQSLDTLISLTIPYSIWQFAVFSYIYAVRKATKHQNKNLSSKSALLIPTVSTSAFHSTHLFLFPRHHIPTNSVAPFSAYKPTHNPQRANARNVSLYTLYGGQFTFSTHLLTRITCYTLPPTQHHSFFRNLHPTFNISFMTLV